MQLQRVAVAVPLPTHLLPNWLGAMMTRKYAPARHLSILHGLVC